MVEMANGETVEVNQDDYENAPERLESLAAGDTFVAGNASCGTNRWRVVKVTENSRGTVFVEAKAIVGYSPGKSKFVAHSDKVGKKGAAGQSYFVIDD